MYIDKQLNFSEEQAITATADSTNIIDLGAAGVDKGEPVLLDAVVEDAFTAAGAATLTVSVITAADAAFTTPETLITTAAIGKATLVRGYRLPINVLPANVKRYVKLNYAVGTGPMTAGKINAGLRLGVQTNT